jgi:hypothetical protein
MRLFICLAMLVSHFAAAQQRYEIVAYPSDSGEYIKYEDFVGATQGAVVYPGWHVFADVQPTRFPVMVYKADSRYYVRIDEDDFEKYKDEDRVARRWTWWANHPSLDSPLWLDPAETLPMTYGRLGQLLAHHVWVQLEDDAGNLTISTRGTYHETNWVSVRKFAYTTPLQIRAN